MEFPVSSFKLRKFSSKIVRDTAAETEEQRAESYTDLYGSNGHVHLCRHERRHKN